MEPVKTDRREYYREYNKRRQKQIKRYRVDYVWPKCSECGYRARVMDSTGCLECYARSQAKRKWTEDESGILVDYAGKEDPTRLQYRLFVRLGSSRSRMGIHIQLHKMGIRIKSHQGTYTITQLAEMIGVHRNTVHKRIRKLGIKNLNHGMPILLSYEDGDRLIESFRMPEGSFYSFDEALTLLGFS